MNFLTNFIKEHNDWKDLLSQPPYNLIIKEDSELPNLYLFKYNQYASDMNLKICQEARGIILEIVDDNVKILCHSFDKFFNYGESQGQEVLSHFDWEDYSFQEKRDGSLMRLWYYQDKWHISTSGTIDAFKAEMQIPSNPYNSFGDMFLQTFLNIPGVGTELDNLDKDYTYSFEMTSPDNKIVVDYPTTELTLIGIRDNIKNIELDPYLNNPFQNIQCAKIFQYTSLDEALNEINKMKNFEGLVLCDGHYNRVKVKTTEYVELARLADETGSDRGLLKMILEDRVDDIQNMLPHLQSRIDKIRNFIRSEIEAIFTLYQQIDWDKDRKEIALQLRGNPYQGFVFKRLNDPHYDFVADYFTVDNLEKIYRTYKEKVNSQEEAPQE